MENKKAPELDPNLSTEYYERTNEQNQAIGIAPAVEQVVQVKAVYINIRRVITRSVFA